MSIFDEINDLSAETVLNRINLPKANDGVIQNFEFEKADGAYRSIKILL